MSNLNAIVKLFLPPIVTHAIRKVRSRSADAQSPVAPPPRRYFGLHELDRQIEPFLDLDGGFYVELGANDGQLASNTLYFERYRNWRGVLVEPAPNLFLECRKNRSAANHIVCAACVPFDYADEFVKIAYSNSMSVSLDLERDLKDGNAHAELGRQFLNPWETVFTFGALARTLNSILVEADAPKLIDFLSLDVEGAEVSVLKGVDHGTFKFRYMLIECRDFAALQSYLAPLGYLHAGTFNEHDYLFKHREAT